MLSGSTQILKCSKYPIALSGEFAVSEAILIHRYSNFNSSHKQTNFDDHTVFKRFNYSKSMNYFRTFLR
jgi:hypothetical protein